MNPFRLALVAGLASATLAVPARAQEPTVVPAQPPVTVHQGPPKPLEQNVRIEVSVSLKGTKPMVKTLSMVTADGKPASGRAGLEIPVRTGGLEGVNYRNVGVNVDVTPQILASGRVMLRLKLGFSNVYKSDVPEVPQPTFGSGNTDLQGVVFESGKPVTASVASDGEAGREYTVTVTATILK